MNRYLDVYLNTETDPKDGPEAGPKADPQAVPQQSGRLHFKLLHINTNVLSFYPPKSCFRILISI